MTQVRSLNSHFDFFKRDVGCQVWDSGLIRNSKFQVRACGLLFPFYMEGRVDGQILPIFQPYQSLWSGHFCCFIYAPLSSFSACGCGREEQKHQFVVERNKSPVLERGKGVVRMSIFGVSLYFFERKKIWNRIPPHILSSGSTWFSRQARQSVYHCVLFLAVTCFAICLVLDC